MTYNVWQVMYKFKEGGYLVASTKNERILIRCESKLKEDATAAAAAENRSLTNFIETLIRQRLYGTQDTSQPIPAKKIENDSPLHEMKHNF